METKRKNLLKIVVTLIFAAAIVSCLAYIGLKGDVKHNLIYMCCVIACCLLSFFAFKIKNLDLSIALVCVLAADYFLIYDPTVKNARIIGLSLLCVAQFLFFFHTLFLWEGNGVKIFNVAFRVAACLVIYFVAKQYYVLNTTDWIFVMFFINGAITMLSLLFKLKTNWLLFFGMLALVIADVYVGLVSGWAINFKVSIKVLEMILKNDVALYASVVGLFLVALSSVWQGKKKLNK